MNNKITDYINQSIRTKEKLKEQALLIEKVADVITRSFRSGGKLILLGNGGSAGDAQHIAAEFIGKYGIKRKALPAIALTTNTSSLTALGNDFGFKKIFSRQLEGLASVNDVIIAISTSGNSSNVLEALKLAKKNKITTIGLTGKSGGKMVSLVDLAIKIPSSNTQNIQESHIMVGHILVDLVESKLQNLKQI
ncbi:MAG: phosphoheptose isomerase [Thaumarchaeota archaeon 13_1_20CM_2_39_20]|nr:MAG: phosphoheptose isomerase [Thaumarchaeota archaeon 13_1_40CM_2_39_13_1]OLE41213.1 MAG: phosphoheptose isomerase [Thaumarchaeota archaeon 13_1_20CM_2_39_20]